MIEPDHFEEAARGMAEQDPDGEAAGVLSELLEMPRGWPRPTVLLGGHRLPVPFIAQFPDELAGTEGACRPAALALGNASVMRRALCVMDKRCQVCGERLGETCVVVAEARLLDGWGDDAYVIDGAGIHPDPCWRAARRLCPALLRLVASGQLVMWEVPTDSLVVENVEDLGPLLRPPVDVPPTQTWEPTDGVEDAEGPPSGP